MHATKRGRWLSMRIEPQLQHIIDRYSNASPYILPVLAKDDSYGNYRQQQRELNKFIRKIGVLLNIPEPPDILCRTTLMGNSGPRLRHTAHGDQRRDGTHVRKDDAHLSRTTRPQHHRQSQSKNHRPAVKGGFVYIRIFSVRRNRNRQQKNQDPLLPIMYLEIVISCIIDVSIHPQK